MTVVSFASVKGAPGVTTLTCLVGASWPEGRRVMVAECDPSGGDLAARFCLSGRRGWSTFATASRRAGSAAPIEAHLQQLPGGLDVLVGSAEVDGSGPTSPVDQLLDGIPSPSEGGWDVLADLGRMVPGHAGGDRWLERSDVVAVLVRGDASSVFHVRGLADRLRSRCGARAVLVVVEGGLHGPREIEAFTGLPVAGTVPFDPAAASVASGCQGSARRLSRSALAASARSLAASLSNGSGLSEPAVTGVAGRARSRRIRAMLAARTKGVAGDVPRGDPPAPPAPPAPEAPTATPGHVPSFGAGDAISGPHPSSTVSGGGVLR
jgi:hypothetical protein